MSRQRWNKIGCIFCPDKNSSWMFSHAALPIAEQIDSSTYRIYFSSRDIQSRSYTGFVIIDLNDPTNVLEISSEPVLQPGNLGEFDDSGAMASWLVNDADTRYLYYIGWNLGVTVPFRNSIGLATNSDQNFVRYSAGPIIDRTITEPHFCASCCVIKSENIWRMWYLSCTEWRQNINGIEHRYHIKYADSSDGIHWNREGIVAIDYLDDSEIAISRPSVVRLNDHKWVMWYSSRRSGDAYKIGYATSNDGVHWVRKDCESGIKVSNSGWDSEMIEYPYVFIHEGQTYMLYNGNSYGETGFGIAVMS